MAERHNRSSQARDSLISPQLGIGELPTDTPPQEPSVPLKDAPVSPTPTSASKGFTPKRRGGKKQGLKDTHTSQAYYIENEIIKIIDDIVGDDWGGKYRLVNDGLKLLIHEFYPEYADRIREEG